MKVEIHPAAVEELDALPSHERNALQNAFEKLEVYGDLLPFPHSAKIKGLSILRELRPRSGRSQWRAFYRRIGLRLVIGAIGPEANVDHHGFRRAVRSAEDRLRRLELEEDRDD